MMFWQHLIFDLMEGIYLNNTQSNLNYSTTIAIVSPKYTAYG
jgi:hypothetical protein